MPPRAAGFILACAAYFAGAAATWGATPGDAVNTIPLRPGPRQLAPWVLTTVPPHYEEEETFAGPRPFVEVTAGIPGLEWTPNYTPPTQTLLHMAQRTTFRRAIWSLEFSFKPVRMIDLDIPQPNGVMQRKTIWYMVYRVVNRGGHLQPKPQQDAHGHTTFVTERVNFTMRCFPTFVLRRLEEDRKLEKEYLDRVIPIAQRAIQLREDPNTTLYSSVQLSQIDIPLSTPGDERPVWGVAIWEDVDPQIDFFCVYVQGLTNAFKFADPDGAFKPGDPPLTGRLFVHRTLQLNFSRPGDEVNPHEREIRVGMPIREREDQRQRFLQMYSMDKHLDWAWLYR